MTEIQNDCCPLATTFQLARNLGKILRPYWKVFNHEEEYGMIDYELQVSGNMKAREELRRWEKDQQKDFSAYRCEHGIL